MVHYSDVKATSVAVSVIAGLGVGVVLKLKIPLAPYDRKRLLKICRSPVTFFTSLIKKQNFNYK